MVASPSVNGGGGQILQRRLLFTLTKPPFVTVDDYHRFNDQQQMLVVDEGIIDRENDENTPTTWRLSVFCFSCWSDVFWFIHWSNGSHYFLAFVKNWHFLNDPQPKIKLKREPHIILYNIYWSGLGSRYCSKVAGLENGLSE